MKKLLWLPIVAVLLISSQTYADGFYLGGSAGQASFDVNDTAGRFSLDDTGWKVFAGWRFNRFVGVDLSYADYGTADDTQGSVAVQAATDSINLFAVGILPAGPRFDLFGKLGVASWNGDVTTTDSMTMMTSTTSDDGTEVAWGFGIGWRLTQKFIIQAEWETLGDFGAATDVKLISLGVRWEF